MNNQDNQQTDIKACQVSLIIYLRKFRISIHY